MRFDARRSAINFVLDAESVPLVNRSFLSQAERAVAIADLSIQLCTARLDASRRLTKMLAVPDRPKFQFISEKTIPFA